MSKKKWTYEACYEEAKKYKTRMEFKNGSGGAYTAAVRNKWLDKFTWLGPAKTGLKYTREVCYKIAQDCKTKAEMRRKNQRAYCVAWKNNWFDDYDWFVDGRELAGYEKRIWDEPRCREAALKCKTLKEFQTKYHEAYKASWKYGYLDKFTWLEVSKTKWNVDIYAYIFPTLKTVYVGLTNDKDRRNREHHGGQKTSAVFRFVQKYNLQIPDMTILKSEIPADPDGRYWEDFYVKKYKTEGWNVLNTAKTGTHASLGTMNRKLTKKKCYELSLDCTTRNEFRKKHNTAYQKSLREGWLDEWEHLGPPRTGLKCTIEEIMNKVYKFENFSDFRKQAKNVYNLAWYKGLIPEIKAYYEKRA